MDEKLIPILAVVCHKVMFLYQTELQDVSYSLGVIPYRIKISGEVTYFVGVCHSCITMETYILSIGIIYYI